MMIVLCVLLGLLAVGLMAELYAAVTAPLGYQDESGFHFGRDHAESADESWRGNPS